MIIYTKQGVRETLPDLIAYDGGVYVFQFYGDETYTDPFDSSVWNWEGTDNSLEEVLGVSQFGEQLTATVSENDCKALAGSWFWDGTNGYLYVHWLNSVGDWSVEKEENRYAKIIAGYASAYNELTKNVFNGVYYKPIITGLSGLNTKVDPTKLGLISFDNSSLALEDEEQLFYNQNQENVVGVPVWVYFVDDTKTTLDNEDRIFTGFYNGTKHNRKSVTIDIIQSRLFENKPACKNTINLTDWPNADDQEGKLKPLAYGDVRRGKVVPVNLGSLSTGSSGSATLLLADPDVGELKLISKIYDEEDNEVTINSSDLTACTATITKASGISPSELKKYKWEGQGYDITGTYNNGLDIIKDAFLQLANIPFLDSTYDTGQWNSETTKNDKAIGFSIQSDKGFIEEIVEPIMTSLQGVLQTLGDGRITFFSRDVDAVAKEEIAKTIQTQTPPVQELVKELVSEIYVEYSRDFVTKEPTQLLYDENRGDVIGKYGLDKRTPISPLKTFLVNESEVEEICEEISETSSDPQRTISVNRIGVNKDIRVFDIIGVDTEIEDNENFEYGEVLSINPNYFLNTESYVIREIPSYSKPYSIRGFEHSNAEHNSVVHGIDAHGAYELRRD